MDDILNVTTSGMRDGPSLVIVVVGKFSLCSKVATNSCTFGNPSSGTLLVLAGVGRGCFRQGSYPDAGKVGGRRVEIVSYKCPPDSLEKCFTGVGNPRI